MVGVLDAPVAFGVVAFLVAVAVQPVELDEPIPEALWQFDLPGTHLARRLVPADEGLRPRTARRRADLQDGRVLCRIGMKFGPRVRARFQHVVREGGKRLHLHDLRFVVLVEERRHVLQRAHAARARVAQPLNRRKAVGVASLRLEPHRNH